MADITLNSKDLLLCMIGLQENNILGELGGTTRLQKFIFLLEKEYNIRADEDKFEFIPYKAGPYSPKIYDDLEFLENLGYIKSEIVGETTEEESKEIDALNFEDMIGPNNDERVGFSDAYLERSFKLTGKGQIKIKDLIKDKNYQPILDGIRKIKSKYGGYSLSDILYYVYSKYPEMTTESEIKNKILGRMI